jgi:hypothetical protein
MLYIIINGRWSWGPFGCRRDGVGDALCGKYGSLGVIINYRKDYNGGHHQLMSGVWEVDDEDNSVSGIPQLSYL